MGLALQLPEHHKSILGVRRLLQQTIAQQYDGVGTKDQLTLHAASLVPRQPFGVLHRGFPLGSLLFDVRRPDLDRNAEHLEQLTAPWRGGGEGEGGWHGWSRKEVVGSREWGGGPPHPLPTNQSLTD